MIRAIRGATTAENTPESIFESTRVMLKEIFTVNGLDIGQIVSIIFTCTKDLDAAFPAVAARELGIVSAALMCVAEMDVPGSLPKCIRVMLLVETDLPQDEIDHVYLKGARVLRPDLV